MNNTWNKERITSCFCGTLLIYIMTYFAVSRCGQLASDFIAHTRWAISINRYTVIDFICTKVSYPLWHFCVKGLWREWGLSDVEAAATATAIFTCFAYLSVGYVWNDYEKTKTYKSNVWRWSFFLFFMGPISAPLYTFHYYGGQGTGNVYHNPTNMCVKGFAVMAFWICANIIAENRKGKRQYWILSLLLLMSALAKPSFLQGIVPGLGLYFFITIWGKEWKEKLKKYSMLVVTFIPSAFVLLFQFMVSFGGGEGIGISYAKVLHNNTPNIGFSFLLAFAFPITVFIINFKNLIKDKTIHLLICYELCAWLEGVFIYEKGRRALAGNWLWGAWISMFIVWMVSLIKFSEFVGEREIVGGGRKVAVAIGYAVLFWQVVCGFFYWYYFASDPTYFG